MDVIRLGLAVVAILILGPSVASAQMVVSRNVGEQVDYPFFSDEGRHLVIRHHHRYRHSAYHYYPRFVIFKSAVPTPQPFGWANCCQ